MIFNSAGISYSDDFSQKRMVKDGFSAEFLKYFPKWARLFSQHWIISRRLLEFFEIGFFDNLITLIIIEIQVKTKKNIFIKWEKNKMFFYTWMSKGGLKYFNLMSRKV